MSTARFPLDLEGKAEDAIISRLKQSQQVASCAFRRQADEAPKQNGIIVVSAKRGAEVVPVSGIYRLTVEIEIQLRIRKNANSLATFAGMVNAISATLETHPAELARQFTAERTDWHCYIAEIVDIDKKPTDMAHRTAWSLQIEAMDVSLTVASKLRNREKH